ncbi:hypothetical protein L914_00020 [Phytophthora nicotianae]|uniref:Retrotransposon Copia-like N-terminal domain-containing protein n=2 Tax=Phytophthora nicotianae TaxID=4792 RepID=V9G2Y6_PHYNI|nr:hypothetical protein F443_00020 [Phytophthora nicotianae P1569]ETM57100.1 hypothetical protein L914_00020 [Phytophthora nicotianae]
MSPSQSSSDGLPRLTGARNFDVWKTRVSASLEGKHLLGFVAKKDYNGVRDDEDEDRGSGSDMSDDEATTKRASCRGKKLKKSDLSSVRPFAQRNTRREKKQVGPIPPSARQLRRMEAQTKAFLMKTMDDTHIRLVKNLTTAFGNFQTIGTKYEAQTPALSDVCSYCQKPRHNIRQCRGLQKDLCDGNIKAGTALPANFELRITNTYRAHPYNHNQCSNNRGGGSWHQGGRGGLSGGRGRGGCGGNRGNNSNSRSSRRDEGGSDQSRRKVALIAVVSEVQTATSAASLRPEANTDLDTSWTIVSGCSSHVSQHAEWFMTKTAASGGITVGGQSQVPIETNDAVEILYSLLSVAAGVDDDYRVNFKRTMRTVQTNQRFIIKAMKSSTSKLYQFTALAVQKEGAHVATTGAL